MTIEYETVAGFLRVKGRPGIRELASELRRLLPLALSAQSSNEWHYRVKAVALSDEIERRLR